MAGKRISFATCNLLNLNEPGERIYSDEDGWTPDHYDRKVAWTAQAVRSLEADVWAFQELWSEKSLAAVFKAAKPSIKYTRLVPKNHKGRIGCAGAVRADYLVGEPEWIERFPESFQLSSGGDDAQTSDMAVQIDRFSRPILHFRFNPRSSGRQIHVYVCHFKSKRPTKVYREPWYRRDVHSKHSIAIGGALSTIRRTAEATALRMILTEQMRETGTPVVVLGDLNDGQHSNTLNILTGQPDYIVSSRRLGGSDVALYSLGTLQEYRSQRDVYYTHVYKGTRESLDHMLVSEEFYDHSADRRWFFKGLEIYNDHLNSEKHEEEGATDHGIVRIRARVGGAVKRCAESELRCLSASTNSRPDP